MFKYSNIGSQLKRKMAAKSIFLELLTRAKPLVTELGNLALTSSLQTGLVTDVMSFSLSTDRDALTGVTCTVTSFSVAQNRSTGEEVDLTSAFDVDTVTSFEMQEWGMLLVALSSISN